MKILLIRHGKTAGNLEKRYIGRTDEPLCPAGIEELRACRFPQWSVLVSSPMQRCLQTAEFLFPAQKIHICEAFRECDFGDFEGKNHAELDGDPQYQAWIDSGGNLPFPNGESPAAFRGRCCDGFRQTANEFYDTESLALVVHGGTIMAILSQFALPHRAYFDWMTANAQGWLCERNGNTLTVLEKLSYETSDSRNSAAPRLSAGCTDR